MGFKKKAPIKRHYVSELDRFLKAFEQKPEASSASRRAEEKKYARIFELRDNPNVESKQEQWENFI